MHDARQETPGGELSNQRALARLARARHDHRRHGAKAVSEAAGNQTRQDFFIHIMNDYHAHHE